MIVKELHLAGFGKWRNRTFSFTPGLNICTAPNESGKTTLIHALIASLYGMKRDYVRVTRYLDEHEQYVPWDQGSYETIVRYRLGNQDFRLHRNLSKDKEFAKLYMEPELTEANALYQEDRRKECNFIEKHLGLTRTVFVDLTWIRSQPMAASERLMPALSDNRAEDPFMRQMMNGLEADLTAIGKKETAENTLLGKAHKQLVLAGQTLKEAESAWQSVQHLTLSVAQWEAELAEVLKQKERFQLLLQKCDQAKQAALERWQLSYETKQPDDFIQWIEQAGDEQERSYHLDVMEQLQKIQDVENQYLALKSHQPSDMLDESAGTPLFLRFAEIAEEEWQSWLKGWYAISAYEESRDEREENNSPEKINLDQLQADYRRGLELHQQLDKKRQEQASLLKQLGRNPSVEHPVTEGWSRSARHQGRAGKHQRSKRMVWGIGTLLMAAVALFVYSLQTTVTLIPASSETLMLISGLFLILAGGLALQQARFTRKQPGQSVKQTTGLSKPDPDARIRLEACESQIKEWEADLLEIARVWQTNSWEEFLLKREEYLFSIHQKQLNRQAQEEKARIQLKLERMMLEWGVPQHLPFEEAARLVLKEHQEWERRSREDQERLERELAQERRRVQLASQYEHSIEIRKSLLAQWEEFVRSSLMKQQRQIEAERSDLLAKLQHYDDMSGQLREQIARATGEIGQRDQISWAKAKSDFDEAMQQVIQLQKRRDALILAQETLQTAWKEWQKELSPDLNEAASEIIQQVTGGRYDDVRLDPLHHYAIRVIEPDTREVVKQNQLSTGTQDQLYFAQRIALLRHISKERESLPILLDDHFIHYDQDRLVETLRYVVELSEEHQIFLFSCQPREQHILEQLVQFDGRHQILSFS